MSVESELRALQVGWPETPDVAASIADRLEPQPGSARRRRPRTLAWPRPVLAVALVIAVAVGAALAVSEPVRAELRQLLGLAGGERIERVERPRTGARLDLGTPVTLADARRRARLAVSVPGRLGAPDAVRLGGDLGPRAVSLLYGTETALTQVPAASAIGIVKQIGGRVALRPVDVGGRSGFWIAAGPRGLTLPGPSGRPATVRSTAIAGASVLLWDRDGVAYRLETRRSIATAAAIARSVP